MTQTTAKRGLLKPVLSGVLVIGLIAVVILFHAEIWKYLIIPVGRAAGWVGTEWVPKHVGQSLAAAGFGVVAFFINWLAHVRGRLREWIFAIVVEIGLWILFWFPWPPLSLNKLFRLNIEQMPFLTVLLSGFIVIFITGVIFWILELKEEINKYRRRHNAEG